MNRKDLDAFVEHHALSPEAVAKAFELVQAVPTAQETRRFVLSVLRIGGVLSLVSGVVFFIAANWDALGVFGHFALIEALLVVTIALAWWRTPPHVVGRLSLFAAFILVGALLALFGQTYQTGADVYELFFTWALLGLPLVVAANWSGVWAAWLVVLNLALLLFCGIQPGLGLLGLLWGGESLTQALSLLVPTLVNLALWFFVENAQSARVRAAAPRWLRRLTVSFGVAFATWAGIWMIFGESGNSAIWLVLVAALGAVAYNACKRRDDVLPLAAIAGCVILLGLCGLVENHVSDSEIGLFFILALWLILSSTVGGRLLMSLQRRWRTEDAV